MTGAPRPITIAILAMGGEGGGVLADWLVDVAEHGAHLVDVERLALRQAFLDVDENDVRVITGREDLGAGSADVPGADDRDPTAPAYAATPLCSFSTSASPTSLVPTAVGSSRAGFMS